MKCGAENTDGNRYCCKCGFELNHKENCLNKSTDINDEPPTPTALIAVTWVVTIVGAIIPNINWGFSLLLCFGVLVSTIILIVNKNSTAKKHGISILIIWIILQIIGYVINL
jgi:uncharacterized RDD family membrane protein YckC